MTRYDIIHKEFALIRARQVASTLIPAFFLVVLIATVIFSDRPPLLLVASSVLGIPAAALLLHHLWKVLVPSYRSWTIRSENIKSEIALLRAQVSGIFGSYRARRKGEAFKKAYDLAGKSVPELEEALAVGMHRERREVFVTAFMRSGQAVRVTASIGSPYRCAAADNPAHWAEHVDRLGCDEIRQYHNHPVHAGTTQPSPTDFRSSGSLRRVLGHHGPKLKSLIIYWNGLGEWKVLEYDDEGRYCLAREFDASVPACAELGA